MGPKSSHRTRVWSTETTFPTAANFPSGLELNPTRLKCLRDGMLAGAPSACMRRSNNCRLGHGHDETTASPRILAVLLDDLAGEVPRQQHEIVGLIGKQMFDRPNGKP